MIVAMPFNTGEILRFETEAGADVCSSCLKPPIDERLEMEITYEGRGFSVSICRHCIAEHAPQVLAAIER